MNKNINNTLLQEYNKHISEELKDRKPLTDIGLFVSPDIYKEYAEFFISGRHPIPFMDRLGKRSVNVHLDETLEGIEIRRV